MIVFPIEHNSKGRIMNTDWENISSVNDDSCTEKLRVPGGWVIRTSDYGNKTVAMVFVPDPNHLWVIEKEG